MFKNFGMKRVAAVVIALACVFSGIPNTGVKEAKAAYKVDEDTLIVEESESPSPSASASASPEASESASASPSVSPSASPSQSASVTTDSAVEGTLKVTGNTSVVKRTFTYTGSASYSAVSIKVWPYEGKEASAVKIVSGASVTAGKLTTKVDVSNAGVNYGKWNAKVVTTVDGKEVS
ncbi:MAG: hypothetical protein K6D02_03310, partial [Lachnospiraceae bacterium]|nr:hypothetical protein [Lachnospiraceae bacterium]